MSAKTPYTAAKLNAGAGLVALVTREKWDGTRCGMSQGRHAAWNWAYRVSQPGPVREYDYGRRSLVETRRLAACSAEFIREAWPGGKTFRRGPSGGLLQVQP